MEDYKLSEVNQSRFQAEEVSVYRISDRYEGKYHVKSVIGNIRKRLVIEEKDARIKELEQAIIKFSVDGTTGNQHDMIDLVCDLF